MAKSPVMVAICMVPGVFEVVLAAAASFAFRLVMLEGVIQPSDSSLEDESGSSGAIGSSHSGSETCVDSGMFVCSSRGESPRSVALNSAIAASTCC